MYHESVYVVVCVELVLEVEGEREEKEEKMRNSKINIYI